MTELYSKLFVGIECDHQALLKAITSICGGSLDGWTVVSPPYELDVRPNPFVHAKDIDGFLAFEYTVEVVLGGESCGDEREYIVFLTQLMTKLHKLGAKVVAASEFEDELPQLGVIA